MKLNVQALMSLLYPLSEDERALNNCSEEEFVKKIHPSLEQSIWSLSSFNDAQVRAAIHLNKFHDFRKAQRLLASLLAQWLSQLPKESYTLIPIPLSKKRELARGHNQVHSIAVFAVAKLPQFTLDGHILKRVRETVPQTTLSSKDRKNNLINAFKAERPECIEGRHIILIDDVYTTGATLYEARKTVMLHGPASLACVAISH